MTAGYARDFKHNYLVIRDDRVLTNDYQIKMLVENNIEGLLNCSERMVNGEGLLYYNITSKQPFSALYEDRMIGMKEITALFSGLTELCGRMEKFLLYGDGLLLSPEYIYYDVGSGTYHFIYYPYAEEKNALLPLLEFLMERTDPDDIRAAEIVYQLADITGRGYCSMNEALSWFAEETSHDRDEDIRINTQTQPQAKMPGPESEKNLPENTYEDTEEQYFEEEEKTPKRRKGLLQRLRYLFFGDPKEREAEEIEYDEEEVFYRENEAPPPDQGEEVTMFIPWTENSEHKLYGTERKNKVHIDLMRAPFTIGKMEGVSDIVIDDKSISRLHAKIIRQAGRFYLIDMNSTNGCFRNGMRLRPNEKAEIEPGDEIGFGRLKFVYR